MAAMIVRRRSRLRGRNENSEENVILDYKKGSSQNLKDVLQNIVRQDGVSKARKLGYFNAFTRLVHRFGSKFDGCMSREEILCCLRIGMLHEAKEMRTACLRALRYYINDLQSVDAFVRLHIDYLVARSLDICLDNEYERIHALRLIRKLMHVAPTHFPRSLLTVMISIANDGGHENDKMVKTCLATICELALSNPAIVAECGGVSTLLYNVLNCHSFPRINESLLATVLYMLNHSSTRKYVRREVDLEQMLAPFTDSHFRLSSNSSDQRNGDERENVFTASKMAVITIIRSWPGMIRLCKPNGTGLQSLLAAFCLPNSDTRKEILDVLCEVFRLPLPLWTDNVSAALQSIDPSAMRDSWRLAEGFVAEEGKAVLPHLTRTRPNLVDNHMALILYAFINAQLLEAMIEVITTSDDHLSLRATIILGELLHLANTIIPHKISLHSHCLPTLVTLATNVCSTCDELERAKRAQMAVTCLSRHHSLKKRGPVPSSLFLDQLLQRAVASAEQLNRIQRVHRDKLLQCIDKESHSSILGSSVHESQVLVTKDNSQWKWDLVIAILKWPDETLRNFNDQSVQRFVRRLLHFFKPTNSLYSAMEYSHEMGQKCSVAALHFIDFLLECDEGGEATKAVEELLQDIGHCLQQIRTQRAPHEALFQPSVLIHTLSQDYFLLLGRFSSSARGEKYLTSTGVYQLLLDLVSVTSHDTYIKLIVSSLDYSRDGMSRIILSKALTATSETARLYATAFVRVLLRARVPFLGSWSMEMLVMQLYDQAKPVAMEALSVISEACEEEVNLHMLIKMRPSVLHLGYKGAMLLARFLSIPAGFKFLSDANYIQHELDRWHQSFNERYVQIVEERLNEAQTTYERTYDGTYTRRSSMRQPRHDVYVPIHLYGQLVQHKQGFQLLKRQAYMRDYVDLVARRQVSCSGDVLLLKTALWALGHVGTSIWGLNWLQEENIIPEMIKVAEENPVFSLRGTAFYVLGLLASTRKGADILHQFGWESVRHTHAELWPVIDERPQAAANSQPLERPLSASSVSLSVQSDGGNMPPTAASSMSPPPPAAGAATSTTRMATTTSSTDEGPTDGSISPHTGSGCSPGTVSFHLESQPWERLRSDTGTSSASRSRSNTGGSRTDAVDGFLPISEAENSHERQEYLAAADSAADVSDGNLQTDAGESSDEQALSKMAAESNGSLSRARVDHVNGLLPGVAGNGTGEPLGNSTSSSDDQLHDPDGILGRDASRTVDSSKVQVSPAAAAAAAAVAGTPVQVHVADTGDQGVCSPQPTGQNSFANSTKGSSESELSRPVPAVLEPTSEKKRLDSTFPTEEGDEEEESTGAPSLQRLYPRSARTESEPSFLQVHLSEKYIHPRSKSDPPKGTWLEAPGPVTMSGAGRTSAAGLLSSAAVHDGQRPSHSNHCDSSPSLGTSKSGLDSLTTDTPTSGISSYGSGHQPTEEGLRATSVSTSGERRSASYLEPSCRTRGSQDTPSKLAGAGAGGGAHHSDSARQAANLRRVPTAPERRFSNPGLGPLSPLKSLSGKRPLSESMIVYAVRDDSHGYATLRQLQRQRLQSEEADTPFPPEYVGQGAYVTKTRSLDLRLSKPSGGRRQPVSHQSLPDLDLNIPGNPFESLTRATSGGHLSSATPFHGRAEYIGLCLPVDVNMIFHVCDEEDSEPLDESSPRSPAANTVLNPVASNSDNGNTGLEHHSVQACLGCYRVHRDSLGPTQTDQVDSNQGKEESLPPSSFAEYNCLGLPAGSNGAPSPSHGKLGTSNLSDVPRQSSITSVASYDSATKGGMTEDSDMGKSLIRKEALRFIVNLSSSISTKSSEQGLLSLKQKFTQAFQDVCLYSEVCFLLSSYNFRIKSRRFIQELFQDIIFDELYKEPAGMLGIYNGGLTESKAATEHITLEKVPESTA